MSFFHCDISITLAFFILSGKKNLNKITDRTKTEPRLALKTRKHIKSVDDKDIQDQ